jgi:TetR/AcrR family transcriptional regulator, transcriptional repressor for nem operon
MDGCLATKTAQEVHLRPKGARTRERILDLAYDAIVEKGFAATSIEELVEAAGISRSGFFYHFKDKSDLARQLLQRFVAELEQQLDEMERRARELHEDPLHAFLIFLKLYEEMVGDFMARHPGCLVAAVTYQDRSFDPVVRALNRDAVLYRRGRFLAWLEEIAALYPLRIKVDLVDLADHVNVTADGGIILSKATGDLAALRRQAALMRETIRLAFGA